MKVWLDNIWSTPTTLHGRVTVADDNGRWRHKYYVACPIDDIPQEALLPLLASLDSGPALDNGEQLPLF